MFPVRAASFGNPDTLAAVATEAGPRGIERLLELQELDLSIDRLTARRDELESGEEVRAARAALEKADNLLGELKLALDSRSEERRVGKECRSRWWAYS